MLHCCRDEGFRSLKRGCRNLRVAPHFSNIATASNQKEKLLVSLPQQPAQLSGWSRNEKFLEAAFAQYCAGGVFLRIRSIQAEEIACGPTCR